MEQQLSQSTVQAAPKTNSLAVTSLILGLVSYLCLGILTALPAVICGHMALARINRSQGRETGKGLAIGGLVAGYIAIVLTFLAIVGMVMGITLPALTQARMRAQEINSKANLKGMGQALALFTDVGTKEFPATLQELIDAGYLVDEMLQSPLFDDPEIDYIYLVPIHGYSLDAPLIIEKPGGRGGRRHFLHGDMNFVGDMDDFADIYGVEGMRKYLNP